MTQNVLSHKGTVAPRRSLRRLTEDELNSPEEKRKREKFDEIIQGKLGDSIRLAEPDKPTKDASEITDPTPEGYFDAREDDSDDIEDWDDSDPITPSGVAVYENSLVDTQMNAEVLLPLNDKLEKATVNRRHINEKGEVVGSYNNNPLLNSIIYDVFCFSSFIFA